MDNQHRQISGYRDLTPDEIDAINRVKDLEAEVGRLHGQFLPWSNIDKRWLAIARTHFEEGFSAMVRSIAQPESRF